MMKPVPQPFRRRLLAGMAVAALAGPAAIPAVAKPAHARRQTAAHKTAPRQLDARERAVQALNRLAFGPRPGDVDAVQSMGVDRWIEQQLHPETIDDSALDAKLAKLPTLKCAPEDMMAMFTGDMQQQKLFNQRRKEQKRLAASTDVKAPDGKAMEAMPAVMEQAPKRPDYASIEALGELNDARILRAAESRRQLQEVLVDFWTNHFNMDAKKGPVRVLLLADQRDVIRPHVLGRFRDLIEASAKSPAMLFYLDNASSTRDFSDPSTAPPAMQNALLRRPGRGAAQPAARKRAGAGLNENYARELMELHTLGVDGGYTQKDVQEVARCLTGWGIERKTGSFRFYPALHDYGQKVVLGHVIPAGRGIEDGEQVLDILSSHPSTARFIARKLCVRLVSDTPSDALVQRAAQTFQRTDGDLREVVRTIVTSPEFLSPAVYRSKYKSPFEFAISSIRALGATLDPPDPANDLDRVRLVADGGTSMGRPGGYGARRRTTLASEVALMGEPLFSHQAPNGYPEDSREWVSAGGLLSRMNFALALTEYRVNDVRVDPSALVGSQGGDVTTALAHALLGTDLSPQTKAAIDTHLGPQPEPAKVAALILGSPDFQKR